MRARRRLHLYIAAIARRLLDGSHPPGTVYDQIHSVLDSYSFYSCFLAGKHNRKEYTRDLLSRRAELRARGLSDDHIHTASRFPTNVDLFVDEVLGDLTRQGIIDTRESGAFAEYEDFIRSRFRHAPYQTHIFPEEERIVYYLAQQLQPKSAVFLGSFYGYWAIWAMPAVKQSGGKAYFVDIDPDASQVAANNLNVLGFDGHFEIVVQNAVEFLQKSTTSYDFALLDADGDATHPDPDYHRKSIYYPIAEQLYERGSPGMVLVCHNMMLSSLIDDSPFEHVIADYRLQYRRFIPFVRSHFHINAEYATSQGVGVYKI